MPGLEDALLEWLAKAIKKQKITLQDLKNPKLLHTLIIDIPNISSVQLTSDNNKPTNWQVRYINLKNIFQSIQNYYKIILKKSFPAGLASINLLNISKGQDQDGLITLLTIIFLACFNSDGQEKYVTYILQLQPHLQEELLKLIKQKNQDLIDAEQQKQNVYQMQQIQRNKIDQYLFKIQSLGDQNQSLTQQLLTQTQQKTKLKQQINKLQNQKRKLKRQLDQKNLYIHQKQQQEQQQQSSKRILSDSNQEIIHLLRKQLVDQQKQHLQQKKAIQQKLETLTQQLTLAQEKIQQLQSQDLIGISANRKVQHQDCVSINQHKNVTQKLQMKLKSLEQKQTELEREILRGKYEYDQLLRKHKKQEKQKQNLKVQYQKISNNRSQMISQKDAQKVKLNILEAIRTKLKNKLSQQKKDQNQENGK